MKTSHEPCYFLPPDLWSLTKQVCNTKSNKNSGFNLLSLFHLKLTTTFCNNVSSIKREVRGQDSYILELRKFSCRYKGCLAAGMDFNIIVPVFARNTKRVKHILLSHQLKLDPTSTDIKPKFFCYQWCSDGAAVASTEKSSSLVKGLSSSGCQLGRDVSRT